MVATSISNRLRVWVLASCLVLISCGQPEPPTAKIAPRSANFEPYLRAHLDSIETRLNAIPCGANIDHEAEDDASELYQLPAPLLEELRQEFARLDDRFLFNRAANPAQVARDWTMLLRDNGLVETSVQLRIAQQLLAANLRQIAGARASTFTHPSWTEGDAPRQLITDACKRRKPAIAIP
jgi:hypothetical protein